MPIFIYHENASGKNSFKRTGDAYAVDEQNLAFAVADSPLRCLIRDTKSYPHDDHGLEAASTFCDSFIKFIAKEKHNKNFNKQTFKEILLRVNREIRKLNKQLGKHYNDPLNYDVAETVGIAAVIINGTLFYGGVEDCYVNVFRNNNFKENLAKWDYQIIKASRFIDKLASKNQLIKYVPKPLQGK